MRIAIIGTGGVGGYLGVKLHEADNDVTFVARGAHLAVMQRYGLRIESPEGNRLVTSTFVENLTSVSPFDLIIVTVKSFDTMSAVEIARPVMDKHTTVLSFQNGVENENILAHHLGKEHILTGIAYIFSTIKAPGVLRHQGGNGKFKFGEMYGGVSDRCIRIGQLFNDAGITGEAVDNATRILWDKWIFICGLGGMTAYAKKPIGEVLADPALDEMLYNVVHEAVTIARKKEIDSFSEIEKKTMDHLRRLPASSTSSMHYDITHGKRVEVEALNGAVVKFGRELKIPTPANEIIYNGLKPSA